MTDAELCRIIEEQQKEKEGTDAFTVGEQLKDMAKSDPAIARILSEDLQRSGMGIQDAAKEIKKYADASRKGNFSFVSPKKAEEILRKFYGLPDNAVEKATDGIMSLADLMGAIG